MQQLDCDFSPKTKMLHRWDCIVEGLERKPAYSLEEASRFLGQSVRRIRRRKDLHIQNGMIRYCDLFQAHLQDVNLRGEKRHPELEQIYNIIS